MINANKNEIVTLYKNKKLIQAIYKGKYLVWQGIRSCFGSGLWINEKPWINNETWKNNR
jgi:hypothetical protein